MNYHVTFHTFVQLIVPACTMQCPSHFKCPESYCIPVRHLCDSEQDCPFGEDEESCSEFRCQGYFWCAIDKRCLSFIDVCDGIIHCPLTEEDESLCDIVISCPQHCFCVGYAIQCVNASLSQIPSLGRNATTLILRKNMISVISSLKEHRHLLHLDISFNEIKTIESEISPFSENMCLLYLNLNSNKIKSLGEKQFASLTNLRYLGIRNNPIGALRKHTFLGLSKMVNLIIMWSQIDTLCNFCFAQLISVHTVIMMRNAIRLIQAKAFYNMRKLRSVLLRYNRIEMYNRMLVRSIPNRVMLETDIPGLCCEQTRKNCNRTGQTVEFCTRGNFLLFWRFYISLNLLLNLPVIVIRFHRSYIDLASVVLQNMAFSEFLMCLHYIYRLHINTGNKRYTFLGYSSISYMCGASEFIFLFSYFLESVLCSLFSIVYMHLLTVTVKLKKSTHLGHKICTVLWIICFAVTFTVFWFSGSIYGLCLPLKYIKGNYAILIYILISLPALILLYICKIIAIREITLRRETAKRLETKGESFLKARLFLDLFISIFCYIPINIFMFIISSFHKTKIDLLILGLDWLLLIKSTSRPILFTFATKSFRIFITGRILSSRYDAIKGMMSAAAAGYTR